MSKITIKEFNMTRHAIDMEIAEQLISMQVLTDEEMAEITHLSVQNIKQIREKLVKMGAYPVLSEEEERVLRKERDEIYTASILGIPLEEENELYDFPAFDSELYTQETYQRLLSQYKHWRYILLCERRIKAFVEDNGLDAVVSRITKNASSQNEKEGTETPDIRVIYDNPQEGRSLDWIIEVVLQGYESEDYFKKLFSYSDANVAEYWIVDPMKNRVMVYRYREEQMKEYSLNDPIPMGIFGDQALQLY